MAVLVEHARARRFAIHARPWRVAEQVKCLAQLLGCDLARGLESIPLGEVITMAAVS
jgi:hypothetical protein